MKKNPIFKYMNWSIKDKPKDLKLNVLDSKRLGAYREINEKRIIKDETDYKTFYKTFGNLLSISVLVFLILGYLNGANFIGLAAISFIFVAILILPIYLYAFKGPEKRLVFNREMQTVEIPNMFWGKPFLIPFKELEVVLGYGGIYSSGIYLAIRPPAKRIINPAIHINIGLASAWECWAFWLWYMDKNRPLPPSESLDKYRDSEIKRLKEDDFPEPLFSCHYYYVEFEGKIYPSGNKNEEIWPPK